MVRSANPTAVTRSPKSFLIIAVGVTIALLYFGREIFIPVALAFVLSFLLTPLVSWIQKLHISRVPAVLIVMTLTLSALAAPPPTTGPSHVAFDPAGIRALARTG